MRRNRKRDKQLEDALLRWLIGATLIASTGDWELLDQLRAVCVKAGIELIGGGVHRVRTLARGGRWGASSAACGSST